ncbi:MAG: DUF1573 domain-containing protein [Bacteroidetes bacterium]|nr:DUF1573 domain-containing protein [Bacteroidota bacterium]MCL1969269.1 DUF1573 domain-containing protein [Bacteroidota bacterium]
MKKLFILSLLIVLTIAISAQVDEKPAKKQKGNKKEIVMEDTLPKVPEIKFANLVHDYGTIYKDGDGVCYFEFTNTGRADLQLTNVSSSCGCTVPQWPKEPIAPGQSAQIKVSYNTSRVGFISKSVFVDWNGGERVTLNIKGNVIEQPKEIVPESKTSPLINND